MAPRNGMQPMGDDFWQSASREEALRRPIHAPFRERYRGEFTIDNCFLIHAKPGHLEMLIVPVNLALVPQDVIESMLGYRAIRARYDEPGERRCRTPVTPVTPVAGGYLDEMYMDFTYGCVELEWIISAVKTSFSTPNKSKNELLDFKHAILRVHGRNAGFGTVQRLLHDSGLQIFDESVQ